MACSFVPAAYGPILRGDAVLTVTPITMFCWFNPTATANAAMIVLNRASGFIDAEHFTFETVNDGTVMAFQGQHAGNTAGPSYAGSYTLNTWQNAGAIFTSNNSRTAYFNGTAGTPDTGFAASPGPTETQIGARLLLGGTVFRPFAGCLAHVAIWDIALSAQNMTDLADGTTLPTDIEPEHLVLYIPLFDETSGAETFGWDAGAGAIGVVDIGLYVTEGDIGGGRDAGIFGTCASSPDITPTPPPTSGSNRRFIANLGPVNTRT